MIREVPFFLIESIDDGEIKVKDKEGLHTCIVDYIEEMMENDITESGDIICYLIYGDEENGVSIVLEDEDGDFIESGWVDVDSELSDWTNIDLEFDDLEEDEEAAGENILSILKSAGADIYEIILQNNDYIDPLNKAIAYFEEVEDYEECERIISIKNRVIEWLDKK